MVIAYQSDTSHFTIATVLKNKVMEAIKEYASLKAMSLTKIREGFVYQIWRNF